MKKLFAAIAASATVIMTAAIILVYASCEHSVADAQLDGKWVSVSGIKLDLNAGSYIRTPPVGDAEKGTFTVSGGNITFNRRGFSPDTQPYSLRFPILTIGDDEYYHDSPAEPTSLEGIWIPIRAFSGEPVMFYSGEPKKGSNGEIEGNFVVTGKSRGRYTIFSRNLPESNVLITIPNGINGNDIKNFVSGQLPIYLLELFDADLIEDPTGDERDWWFTFDEARRFFQSAARKATDMRDESMILSAQQIFFSQHETMVYDYRIETDINLTFSRPTIEKENNKLQLRYTTGGSAFIFDYARVNLDYKIPFSVIYDINGGTLDPGVTTEYLDIIDITTVDENTEIAIRDGSGFSNPGFTFGGWNTRKDGIGINYTAGSDYTVTHNVTLYAKWN
jgi:uncharacterized repeat protein (TIGR02543 family)